MNYLEFIRSKIEQAPVSGFDIDTGELHHVLLPHQRDIVKWLVKGGRRALFASFGLGKTIMELEDHNATRAWKSIAHYATGRKTGICT